MGLPGRLRRQWRLQLAAAVVGMAIAGCGSSSSTRQAAPAPTQAAARVETQTAAPVATTTATRTAAPTGTAAAAAGSATPAPAGAAAATAGAGQVQIVEPKTGGVSNPQTWTYTPNTINVVAGTRLTWTNSGEASHTVTADDGAAFDSGAIQRGDTWAFTFSKPGTYKYHCTFHAWMTGTVVVGA